MVTTEKCTHKKKFGESDRREISEKLGKLIRWARVGKRAQRFEVLQSAHDIHDYQNHDNRSHQTVT